VRREAGVLWHDAELFLAREPFLGRGVPSGVEASAILLEVFLRRLMRRVSRAESKVEKERALGNQRLGVANETHRASDDIFGDVIALGERAGRIDEVIVGGELGVGADPSRPAGSHRNGRSPAAGAVLERPGGVHSDIGARCHFRSRTSRSRARAGSARVAAERGIAPRMFGSRCPCWRCRASAPRVGCVP
jgi:hypothetical protein